jgi:hypothetical protein
MKKKGKKDDAKDKEEKKTEDPRKIVLIMEQVVE